MYSRIDSAVSSSGGRYARLRSYTRFAGHVFRIGHLGHLNDLTLIGALGGVQLALRAAGVPVPDGLAAATEVLA